MTAPPQKHGSTSNVIADALREAILHGEYRPGQRIIQEQLSAKFGGSRIPVREAMRALESEGLVRMVANTGAWVASLTPAECSEVYQTRERLEPLLLRQNAEALTTDLIAQLDDLAHRMERAQDVEEFLELDRQFHLSMYRSASTYILGELVERLWNTTQPYRRAYTQVMGQDNRQTSHNEHHLMVTALREGDLDAAEGVLALHIRRTRLHLERHPEIFDPSEDTLGATTPHQKEEATWQQLDS
jgi:DNA-binding GntR family transcriptional regulator